MKSPPQTFPPASSPGGNLDHVEKLRDRTHVHIMIGTRGEHMLWARDPIPVQPSDVCKPTLGQESSRVYPRQPNPAPPIWGRPVVLKPAGSENPDRRLAHQVLATPHNYSGQGV